MSALTKQEMLQALKAFDTPSITNVVATYPGNPLCLGLYNPWTQNWYTDWTLAKLAPEAPQSSVSDGSARVRYDG